MLTPQEVTDSTRTIVEDGLSLMKSQSLTDLIHSVTSGLVRLAIDILIALLVFYIGRYIIRKLTNLVATIMVKREVDFSLTTFVISLVKIVLYFILIVTIIGILGLETSSFLALFASAGVAIGMAISGTLQNFAGGVLILLLKPYKIGDYIEAQGYAGTVKEIQIFSTVIITSDNKLIIIPNGPLSTSSINNWSKEGYRRVVWNIGISYGDKVESARDAVLKMFDNDSRIVNGYIEDDRRKRSGIPEADIIVRNIDPKLLEKIPKKDGSPSVVVSELADSSVVLQVRAWVQTSDYWDVFYQYNERFYNELPDYGINFPFPQMSVHISPQES